MHRLDSSRSAEVYTIGITMRARGHRLAALLNSLSADFTSVSCAMLAEGGRFGEIGKRGVWSEDKLAVASGQQEHKVIACDTMWQEGPAWMQKTLALLCARAGACAARALPLVVFGLESDVTAPFRYLQRGQNIGKVVVRIATSGEGADQLSTDGRLAAEGAHLITGGTGGIGLLNARWLGQIGAPAVLLVARSGKISKTGAVSLHDAPFCAALVGRCDASQPSEVRRIIGKSGEAGVPLRGVWHAAGVLKPSSRTRPSSPPSTFTSTPLLHFPPHASHHHHSL